MKYVLMAFLFAFSMLVFIDTDPKWWAVRGIAVGTAYFAATQGGERQ